jgi:monoamine oxidase
MKKADVLVIGAGVAGLAAASKLAEAGRKVHILEARSRLGGRVMTQHENGLPHAVELGAEFVHDWPKEITELASAKHNALYHVLGDHRQENHGQLKIMKDIWKDIFMVFGGLKHLKKDESLKEYLGHLKKISTHQKYLAEAFIEGFDAAESEKISAKSLADFVDEVSDHGFRLGRFLNGYDGLLENFQNQNVAVYFNTVVKSVKWSRFHAEISAEMNGQTEKWTATQVLTTVPVGVLKAPSEEKGAIRFQPPLSEKSKALKKIEMGPVVKIILLFDEIFWPPELAFVHLSEKSPFQVIWTYAPFQVPLLALWAGGSLAIPLSKRDEREILTTALEVVEKTFKPKKFRLQKYFFHNWQKDPFARGAYAYPAVGGMKSAEILAKPVEGTLFFAGEAMNLKGPTGTVDAAISSGYRAAEEILKAYSGGVMKPKNKWSAKVTKESHSLDLDDKVFTKTPKEIAVSLKHSAEKSKVKKTTPYRSAMSMLNFYINRAGDKLPKARKAKLEKAKDELRHLFNQE